MVPAEIVEEDPHAAYRKSDTLQHETRSQTCICCTSTWDQVAPVVVLVVAASSVDPFVGMAEAAAQPARMEYYPRNALVESHLVGESQMVDTCHSHLAQLVQEALVENALVRPKPVVGRLDSQQRMEHIPAEARMQQHLEEVEVLSVVPQPRLLERLFLLLLAVEEGLS